MSSKPWREAIQPHPDVQSGGYDQAEFVANLAQVQQGQAEPEYQDPAEFFARTYLTEGLHLLLVCALQRLCGSGGEPVIQVKTAFGGGKTHAMLALYHMVKSGRSAATLPGLQDVFEQAGRPDLAGAKAVVLVGTALSPSKPWQEQGVGVRTLWGALAAQLGGPEGHAMVQEADQRGVSPGSNDLLDVLERFGPAVILIDELVAYARNLWGVSGLPGGSFDANMTFVHALTEAIARSKHSLLLASIPESEIEIGGEGGEAPLERLQHTFGRLEAIWKPVGATESFEIVRRRLFGPLRDKTAQEETCQAFCRWYEENPTDFPAETREAAYLDRLRGAYPIHPELFARLYEDWSSLENFQRTRGVLRLLAAVIHELWQRNDQSLLILPGSLPLDAPRVRNELLRYLGEGWNAVVDNDVDGERSEPRAVDMGNARFGALSAARRVARAIFLGSAPHVRQATVRGVEDVRVRLGVVQPGESVAVFNDALGRLTERLTHLYSGNRRFWYDTQPNLRRTMEDRASRLEEAEVDAEIQRRLRQMRERGDLTAVHVCPASADVPDEQSVRLVVLPPAAGHRAGQLHSPALAAASDILDHRGDGPRNHRNMLLFVAADANEVEPLRQEARRYLAWHSIVEDADSLNLDAHQRHEAEHGRERSSGSLDTRLNEAYAWLLVPRQEGTAPLQWETTALRGGGESPIAKVARRVRSSELLITRWSPALLRMELDRWFWSGQSHVGIKRVWDCLASYPYLPRLRDQDVFLAAVRDGLRSQEWFGYAASVSSDGRYQGLQFGFETGSIYLDAASVLVTPEAALRQLQAEAQKTAAMNGAGAALGTQDASGAAPQVVTAGTTPPQQPRALRRFHGRATLDSLRLSSEAGKVHEEVVQHLKGLPGAVVEVSLEIKAFIPDGAPDNVVRTVTENCRTLKFESQGFEEE